VQFDRAHAVEPRLERLEREQRALDAHRVLLQRDADQLQQILLGVALGLLHRHALDLVGEQRRRRLADRTPAAAEAHIRNYTIFDFQIYPNPVTAERVVLLVRDIRVLERAGVVRVPGVFEDQLAVQIAHLSTQY